MHVGCAGARGFLAPTGSAQDTGGEPLKPRWKAQEKDQRGRKRGKRKVMRQDPAAYGP